ncbi:hypothetical protein [Dyella flagellata]|uniref:Uncharacterized protein n=1 Tax=Dyella flagellata TaxID=1867833 RepID=A0ABQ5X9R2_9GAMM|nr:hypothetical protein [Dyella flagellata]GLQ87803.1 hypothetical protein GCM10007898_13710 [Dyella flagellata]
MKTNKPTQTKMAAEPAAGQSEGAGAAQRKVAATPRQASEAAHIAQLKGDAKPKGKVPPPKKGKGK